MQVNYSDHVPEFKNKDELSKFLTKFAFQRFHINRAAQLFGKGDATVTFNVKEGIITVQRGEEKEVIDLKKTEGKSPTWTFASRSEESINDSINKINALAEVILPSEEKKEAIQRPEISQKKIEYKQEEPAPSIIHYTKGERKTRDIVPTQKKMIGFGNYGGVYEHGEKGSILVKKGKKSTSSTLAEREFKFGSSLTHPNLVKSHNLFIKSYPDKSLKSKIEMDKVRGKTLSEMHAKKIPLDATKNLLKQAKELSLYLFHNGVTWRDLNKGNIMIEDKADILKIIDYGSWEQSNNPKELVTNLLIGSMELTMHLLDRSAINRKYVTAVSFPEQFFNDRINYYIESKDGPIVFKDDPWFKHIESKLDSMNENEVENLIKDYFDQVVIAIDKQINVGS